MKLIRLATIALLSGVCINCSVYGQSPGYGPPPGSQPGYDHDRGYDNDRYYDDGPTPGVEVGFFYDELSPYGDWVLTRDFGWAWFPRDVRPYWSPYTEGRWVVTEYGWTWVSYEPFGWATYHYGRWVRDVRFGWLWVPGTTWGPAWVSWQYGGGYVGWAPLPPAVEFEIGFGIRLGGFDLNVGIRSDAYTFVSERSFLEPRLSGHLIPRARNVTIIHNTTNVTNYTYVDNRVMNRGVDVREIERATGRHVQPLRVAGARAKTRSEVAASEVRIYRPEKQQLDSVRVARRVNPEQRAATRPAGRDQSPPAVERRDVQEVRVAPRVNRAPPVDPRQLERQERREKQELAQHQAEEKQQIDRLYQRELAKAQAQTERAQVEKRHQAEREALQQGQRNAAQQLVARQEVKRQAVLAKPPGGEKPQAKVKAADPKHDKSKVKVKKEKQKGHGKGEKPAAPPAGRR